MPQNDREPQREVILGDSRITLLGTAHVSRSSAEKVKQLLATDDYDAVAVELCPSRYNALINPDDLAKMDLLKVVREKRVLMVIANLALGAYQQRLADQFGIAPGEEQREAIRLAKESHRPLLLIDREISTTLKRVAGNLSWWKRFTLFTGIIATIISKDEVTEEDIEHLKEGDILETTFAEFAEDRQDLYLPLIDERDRYMAARLQQEIESKGHEDLLVVVGAGHMNGIAGYLETPANAPGERIKALEQEPKPSRWPKFIPWAIVLLVVSGFVIGFQRNPSLGWQLVLDWVIINGGLSALGALLAAAHPLTVFTAFVAAPLTSLNPAIGAGMVTAAAELMLRKPTVADFAQLRNDTTAFRGWWKNRVSRTLLVFLFSTLGSAIGTYVAGFRIFERLVD
ncbi:MAG: conjugal transfer protein TraB [gamma proteobacterium symbiont of Ctena orbiculata]|uniref:TraB/GumN family protein n=1 Tax=Candidatus Thiodiazotropha taylori TaxID=2792791 RepID=A0A944MEK5_9GAMM|nr:TraB/GumN family protein [Candidatus Thiodiazotropha taylori]PUB88798.1 MAG: conjugal transfer protein TraB [gamma proteobacterium symbiont of Ctena orbiculata]MBT2989580.1 TraB/GumN family protein [Candidatus Thiodiazotropha taylori]MBT2997161.1 TraB/GumN family protein [Candidatus Thiodiazotropha taylori]MBT3001314.1 TraB/GumN family protein [Candidatus Thiodiazotropha taylori]